MNNKITTILLGAILAVGIGVLIVSFQSKGLPEISVNPPEVTVNPILGSENEWYQGVTHATVAVSITALATSTNTVLAANSGRQYARIQNMCNTRVSCFLSTSTVGLAVGAGIVLNASSTESSSYEIMPDNLYKGMIRCIAETATCTVSTVEK
jgi:hypothetical protein